MAFRDSFKTAVLPVVFVALAPLATGCATVGLIYEDVGHPPIQITAGSDSAGIAWDPHLNASTGGRALVKRGVACSQDILKLVAWGDATQAAAAKQGGVTEVVGVDFDNTAILGFVYTRNCTVVYGNDAAAATTATTPPSAEVVPEATPLPAIEAPSVPSGTETPALRAGTETPAAEGPSAPPVAEPPVATPPASSAPAAAQPPPSAY